MNKLQVGGLVAIFAFVTACDGCGPPPPPTPDPSRSEVTVDRPTGAIADGADQVQIRVTVRDGSGNPVEGVEVTIATTGTGNALLQPAYPTDANGVAAGRLSTTVAESKTLSASIAEGDIPSTATAAFGPGPVSASTSTVVASPTTVVADGADFAAITVTLRDASGNPIPGKAVTLSATGAQNTIGQPSATDARGQTAGALRSTVAEAKVASAIVDGTELPQQPSLQFVPGPADKLVFAVQPSDATAGATIAPQIQVAIQDAAGNLITAGSDVVTVSLVGAGTLSGTTSAAASGGIATFSDLSINRAQAGATLVATATGLADAASLPFGILPGPADHLAFFTQPSTATSGAAIAPAVRVAVQDALGNTLPTDTRAISLALGSNPGGAALSGTTTAAAGGGVATFDTLSLDKAGSGYTLVAAAGGVTGAESGGFDVTAGPASKLAFAVQPPASVTSDAAFAPPVQVVIQDAAGNTVLTATGAIALSLAGGTAGAVLSGTLTQAAVGGVATFAGLSVDRAGAGYALDAAGAALAGATSTTFSVVPGAPSKLVFFTQPPDAVAGQPISPPPSAAVTDAAGNVVSTATDAITVSLGGGTAGAVLSGTLTRNASSGVATFDGLSVDRSGSGYALGAAAASLTSASSATFSISAGAPDRLAVTLQPVNRRAGQPFTVEIAVQDALGNTAPSPAQTVGLSLVSGPAAALGGTTTLT
ncbi:MAG TPA: Ig-like domain-containing protein, partial [Myxococcales bacterium]|nr:Ig-like domain-containing protein [Myxococcales bacterium]